MLYDSHCLLLQRGSNYNRQVYISHEGESLQEFRLAQGRLQHRPLELFGSYEPIAQVSLYRISAYAVASICCPFIPLCMYRFAYYRRKCESVVQCIWFRRSKRVEGCGICLQKNGVIYLSLVCSPRQAASSDVVCHPHQKN